MSKETALPKNIRQIGDVRGRERIYLEDYVMTYIRKKEKQEEQGYLGIFLGERQETEESVSVFVRGILEIPEMPAEGQENAALGELIQAECQKYFPEWEVQGCCVIGTYPSARMEQLAELIPESAGMLYHLQEQEETLYWMEKGQYERIKGYFVFYEQNRKMQEYLAELFQEKSVEKESLPDKAIKTFRQKVKEKGLQKNSSMLKLAGSFFVVTVLVIGAIAVNRVDDLRTIRNMTSDSTAENEADRDGAQAVASDSAQVGAEAAAGDLAQDGTQPAVSDSAQNSTQRLVNGALMQDSTQSADSDTAVQNDAGLAGPDSFWENVTGESAEYEDTQDSAAANTTAYIMQSSDAANATADGDQSSDAANAAGTSDQSSTAANAAGTSDQSSTAASGTAGSDQSSTAANATAGSGQSSTAANAAGTSDQSSTAANATAGSGQSSTAANAAGTSDQSSTAANATAGSDQSSTGEEPAAQEAAVIRSTQASYIIREGDTLADICNRYYGSLEHLSDLCEANEIEDANVIMPGQKIVLP